MFPMSVQVSLSALRVPIVPDMAVPASRADAGGTTDPLARSTRKCRTPVAGMARPSGDKLDNGVAEHA